MRRAGDAAWNGAGQRRGFRTGQQADVFRPDALQAIQFADHAFAPTRQSGVAKVTAAPEIGAHVEIWPAAQFETPVVDDDKIATDPAAAGNAGPSTGTTRHYERQGQGRGLDEISARDGIVHKL